MIAYARWRWTATAALLAAAAGSLEPAATERPFVATAGLPIRQSSNAASGEPRTILFFGDSLTAGLGVDEDVAFPALIRRRIDDLDWDFDVVAAGNSGETTAGGVRRIEWVLRRPADLMVLELGANDGLRGVAPETTATNLQAIVDRARGRNPDMVIVVAGMRVPPNLGPDYARRFAEVFTTLAERNELHLIPFLLEGVGGRPDLNLADGIHPNEVGHRIVADNVWVVLEPLLRALRREDRR